MSHFIQSAWMSLRIIKAGVLDTIQDMGRYGYQRLGINPGGVMDVYSASIANILIGNSVNEALLEMHFPAPVILFQQPALISICGANFSASINGEPVPNNHPIAIEKNSILQFLKNEKGSRCYLAIRGGLDLPLWLGSRSTHLKAGAGGFLGRALKKKDEIGFRSHEQYENLIRKKAFHLLPWSAADIKFSEEPIRVIKGNEWDRLSNESMHTFFESSFEISKKSDRMGFQLTGNPMQVKDSSELVSTPVSLGTIQLLPDGNLIVLMADHQSTGGYPRIAHVLSTEVSRLAQMQAGEEIRFVETGIAEAESLLSKQEQYLLHLKTASQLKLAGLGLS